MAEGDGTDALGMNRPIQRRDFLNGVAVTALGLSTAEAQAATLSAPQDTAGYDPPVLTGLRGSHPGSFEVAHSLRDGSFWRTAPAPQPGEDVWDLVIVGAGISGLAAAHFYRTQRPGAKILILDNHDDFGGHAKRNEFALDGGMQLMNGGTLEIDSPRPYSAVSDGLLRTLGIEPVKLEAACANKSVYESMGLGRGIFFGRETFGRDALVAGVGEKPWGMLLAAAPMSERARADIVRLEEGHEDFMPGLSSEEKKARLSRMSYRDFLLHVARADPGVLPYYQGVSLDEWGVGIDAISALDIWGFGYTKAGFAGLNLKPGSAPRMGNTPAGYADGGSYFFHFPDGNASIARLLVRRLVPAAVPGSSVSDVVTSRVDYTQLDRAGQAVRIRLSSIVVGARNIGTSTASEGVSPEASQGVSPEASQGVSPEASQGVEIAYARSGQVVRVRAQNCVLAGYNMMIPFICPEMPKAQRDGLHYLVKVPLVYTSVAVRDWQPLVKLGVQEVYAPGSYWTMLKLNPVTDIGAYRSPRSPDGPALLRMTRVPCHPGLDERSQHRLGHAELLATPFATYEGHVRDQLGRMFGAAGFDAARDITAITVNRWPHGYAYEYNPLFDPDWAPGQAPHELGRARFGRIAIANSDSGAAAYTDSAIDQAHRAVQELLAA